MATGESRLVGVLGGLVCYKKGRGIAPPSHKPTRLDVDYGNELFYGGGALVEGHFLFGRQLDFYDLLDALGAEFYGDAYKKSVNAVLSVEVGGAGENLLFVLENGFNHFGRGGRGGVISRSGLEIFDDLGAPVSGALHDGIEAVFRDQFGDGNTSDGGVAGKRDHSVAVSSENEGGYVLDADLELSGNKGAKAGGIQDSGHADDALAGKAADLVSGLRHGVERIGDDDEDAVRRILHDLADHVIHDFVIGIEEVVAAHTGLARDSCSDHDNV